MSKIKCGSLAYTHLYIASNTPPCNELKLTFTVLTRTRDRYTNAIDNINQNVNAAGGPPPAPVLVVVVLQPQDDVSIVRIEIPYAQYDLETFILFLNKIFKEKGINIKVTYTARGIISFVNDINDVIYDIMCNDDYDNENVKKMFGTLNRIISIDNSVANVLTLGTYPPNFTNHLYPKTI